jgi:exopolyphosphatase/guanosine-5'-triphosphate,3'-diphosphate pyrophosphatase
MSKTHNSSQVIAVATQAARRAPNFSELQRKILTSLGIDLRIISGTEEATLMASCVRRFMSLDKFISFDIGCGSVEVAEFNGDLKGTWSLPLSTIDLSKMENFKEAEVATEKILKTVKFHDAGVAQYPLVGSGGTLRVANLLMEGGMGKKITCQEVKSLLGTLKNKTNEERVALGVPKVRADVFPYGLLVVCKLMERVQIRELQVMLGNLRLSLAMNYFNTLD